MVALFERMMTPCTKLTKLMVSDGEGGWNTSYVDSYDFDAAIMRSSSTYGTLAEKAEARDSFMITVPKDVYLSFHDVFRRKSDGKTFLVTGDVMDRETPEAATFSFRRTTAVEWELPEGTS